MVVFRIVNITVCVLLQQLWILLYCRRHCAGPLSTHGRVASGARDGPDRSVTSIRLRGVMPNRNSRLNLSLGSQPRVSAFPGPLRPFPAVRLQAG